MTKSRKEKREKIMKLIYEIEAEYEKRVPNIGIIEGLREKLVTLETKKQDRYAHQDNEITLSDYMDLRTKGLSKKDIAEKFSLPVSSLEWKVKSWREKGELKSGMLPKGTGHLHKITFKMMVRYLEDKNMSIEAISRQEKVSTTFLYSLAKKNNYTINRSNKKVFTEEEKETFVKMRKAGHTVLEIAIALKCSRSTLTKQKKEWGIA